jgi:hypothetical protein
VRSNSLTLFLTAILLFTSLPFTLNTATADTVIRSESVDILPAGTFEDQLAWTLSAEQGYTGDPADFTTISIADGELQISHTRPESLVETTAWSSYSVTGSSMSLNTPDGAYNYSSGPTIEVSSFDFSEVESNALRNVSLVVAYEIPNTLQDDSVRFIIEWSGKTELVREISHTWAAVDHSASNPMVVELSGLEVWDWNLVDQITVTIDYVSVGGVDDSRVEVDAVGLIVKHLDPDFGFEYAKALHDTPAINSPVLDFDSQDGEVSNLALASCGLEIATGESVGTWDILNIVRPHDQYWGRVHLTENGNSSLKIRATGDASWLTLNDGEQIPLDVENIDIRVTIFDGCVERFRIDINDPTVTIRGRVTGNTTGLISNLSGLSLAVGESLVIETIPLLTGSFEMNASIGHLLPELGRSLSVGIATRIQWSSNGSEEQVEVIVEEISIGGGYLIEWDRDPVCDSIADQTLQEDGGGLLIYFLGTCIDDITAVENLDITATSSDTSILIADVVQDSIRIQPQLEKSGDVIVVIVVTDQRGNIWEDLFTVSIGEIADPPVISGVPMTQYLEIGSTTLIQLEIVDPDSSQANLILSTDKSWATIDAFNRLTLQPVVAGQHMVTISVTDGTSTTKITLEVIATAKPDLEIEEIQLRRGEEIVTEVTEGEVLRIEVFVRNSGSISAEEVTVHCVVDGIIIESQRLDVVESGSLKTVTCDWQAPFGTVNITGRVDPTAQIDELEENDNERTILLTVIEKEKPDDGGGDFASGEVSQLGGIAIYVAVAAIVLAAIIFLQIGPGRIQRPHQRPPRRGR